MVSIAALASRSWMFCQSHDRRFPLPTLLDMRRDVIATLGVLAHVSFLYLGPLLCMGLELLLALRHRRQQHRHGANDTEVTLWRFIRAWKQVYIEPTWLVITDPRTQSERWILLRNLFIAPLAEEVVFRACFVPVLFASQIMTQSQVIVVAPLFFALAHVHHAVICLQNAEPLGRVLLRALFQCTYTTLFGCYTTFVFLRTGSLLAVVLCHSLCNALGLPDISFLIHPQSVLYPHRVLLGLGHVGGVLCFVAGFQIFSEGLLSSAAA